MGNSPSNANHTSAHRLDPSRRTDSPSVSSRGGSPAPSSSSRTHPHRSLRQKKKSLELPDLASLAFTPASSQSVSPHTGYRRPRASSPIPIPTSANPAPQTFRPQNNLPSAAHLHFQNQGKSRHKSYLSSAYPSTHSFVSGSPPDPAKQVPPAKPLEYVPEVVHSTLPVLLKAEEEVAKPEPVTVLIKWRGEAKAVSLARAGHDNWNGRQSMAFDPHTNVWTASVQLLPGTHHFKFVVDDQWRIADEYPTAVDDRDGSLANYVNVTLHTAHPSTLPSHHPYTHTPARISPLASPQHPHPNQYNSFWSDTTTPNNVAAVSSDSDSPEKDGEWTTEIPPELIAAAAEEENYLASADSPTSSLSIPAPNIPPAPALPRHLDKLILNARPNTATVTGSAGGAAGSSGGGGGGAVEREKSKKGGRAHHHSRRDREGRSRPSNLGMTASVSEGSGVPAEGGAGEGSGLSPSLTLPVVTASGTDITSLGQSAAAAAAKEPEPSVDAPNPGTGGVGKKAMPRLDGPGVADDASVLPVPNHVVLHHLSTSAIRNGVLAVANTTRYRKKYITTIYYKPT